MEVRAKLKFARITPRKCAWSEIWPRVCRLGKAQSQLRFCE
jgi:hypothetical protein